MRAISCSTYFNALQQIRNRKLIEMMYRISRDPGCDPRGVIVGMFVVDLRDATKLCQNTRLFVRNVELEDLATGELALAHDLHQPFNPSAGECGDVERRALSPSAGKSARRSTDVLLVVHIDHSFSRNPQ